jgi:23S rRNA (guanosine2251-2'-O)-methyltransferase
MIVYGINPVLEALRAGRVKELRVGNRSDSRLREILVLAGRQQIPVRRAAAAMLDRESRGGVHQGVVADLESLARYDVADLVRDGSDPLLVVVLDGIEDPHNVGAIVRTADAAGADGLIVQSRRSAFLGGAVVKASAGAVATARIAEVVNIARAIDELKEAGVWTIGLSGDATTHYDAIDFTLPSAVVLGAEGSGLRRLVRERCDYLAAIPMQGRIGSLNVSVAAGIALFEAVRQRRRQAKPKGREMPPGGG